MEPITFKEQNCILHGTKGGDVKDLPCYRDSEHVISGWSMTFKERIKVLFTGRVWFWVVGNNHPPISLDVDYPFSN